MSAEWQEFCVELNSRRGEDDSGRLVLNERIAIGKYSLSVQASEFYYCSPRETLPEMGGYSEVEFALFDAKTGKWLHVGDTKEFAALSKYSESPGPNPVCCYVPTDELMKCIVLAKQSAEEAQP